MDCVFCKIASGAIPAAKVFEDDETICFLDIAPASRGHLLVIPKKHYTTMLEMPDALLANTICSVKKAALLALGATGLASANILANNGREAGQVVMHAHFHVIPRMNGDGIDLSWKGRRYDGEELKETLELITGSDRG